METMFTTEQIQDAHSKVKSGADFPMYIQAIKQLGVRAFETWVEDSHTKYFGYDGYQTSSEPMYGSLVVSDESDKQKFSHYLQIHQEGKTDYFTFCKHCAETGIRKWFVNLDKMICTYYDSTGNEILIEQIPG